MAQATTTPRTQTGSANGDGHVPPALRAPLAGEEAVPRGLAAAAAIIVRLAIVLGGLYLLGVITMKLLVLVIPLVVSLLLATLLEPPARYLRLHGWRPATAAVATVGSALILIVAVLSMVLPPFVSELGALSSTIERGVRDIGATVAGGPFGLTEAQVDRSIDRAIETLRGAGGTVAKGVLTGAVLLTQWATATLLTIFLTFFFVKDGPALWRWVIELFARNRQPHIHALGLGAWSVLTAYVQGAALVATIDAVLIGILLVVVGVPLAVPLVTLTFLAAFFPIVGAFVAGAAAVLVALVANGPVAAGIVLAGVVVIQQLEGNVFYPVVVGRRLALHPVAMLAALTAGGLLGGIAGAFLATPLAAVIGAVIAYSRSDQRLLNASGAAPASQLRPS